MREVFMSGEKEVGKEERDAGKDVTEALKSLIARIGDIFGVFDLSFFVAGAVCLGALVFGTYIGIGDRLFEHVNLKDLSGLEIAAVIIACYVLGLVCFAIGRPIHWRIWSRSDFYA